MHRKVTIVMYHYVRDLKHSRYPGIRGLDISLFKEQILYLKKHYNFITAEQLIDTCYNDAELPPKAVLLTFDDAYSDHYINVFPFLDENNIQGVFFPPVKAITEHKVLDVNKIHFILASCQDAGRIIDEVLIMLKKYRNEFDLKSNEWYYKKLAHTSRFDTADTIFIKRLLQTELPEKLRNIITDKLFSIFVGIDEEAFSRELYMNIDQLKCMQRNGMHIGSHGYEHYWLNSLTKEEQRQEIVKSLTLLKKIAANEKYRTFCFPYGAYNNDTLNLLQEYNFKTGFSTEVNIADLSNNNILCLPRLDTNDLPKNKYAKQNSWYNLAQ
jgi:peptidoglycan/xylan/chitin deacetylase (PgdA/CDA1 family)